MEACRVSAVIFDLDGTLLDTERPTKGILKEFLAKYGKVPDAEKEERRLGKMQKESAAGIVEDYKLPLSAEEFVEAIMPMYRERWPKAKALPGANRLMRHLHKHGIPLALASNSIKKNVEAKISLKKGWKGYFSVILGGDEVNQGKPSPDIFIEAAKRLGVDTANCLVIEDSPVGVRAAKAAGANVVAVPSLLNQAEHYSIANCVLHSLLEFQPETWGLPAFEDWVQNALPIEPLYAGCLISEAAAGDGFTDLNIIADEDTCESIPDQLSGVFAGWAELEQHGIFKVATSIGWDISFGIPKRVIQCRVWGYISSSTSKEHFHLLLVGYIRNLHHEANITEALTLSGEDESIVQAALDLPILSHYITGPLLIEASFL